MVDRPCACRWQGPALAALVVSMNVKRHAIGWGGTLTVLALTAPLVMRWEGNQHRPYLDPTGTLTVCYGHTGADIIADKTYSMDECEALLQADLAESNAHVNRCLPMPKLVQIEAALTSATFNIGPNVVCGSTLQRKAQANDWPGACAELERWRYSKGRELRGLTLRRADERALCEGSQHYANAGNMP